MTEREDTRTLAELAAEALLVQDACNLTGIARSSGRALARLMRLCPELSTTQLNEHPIAKLWADKFSHLAGIQDDRSWVWEAYSEVTRLATAPESAAAHGRIADQVKAHAAAEVAA